MMFRIVLAALMMVLLSGCDVRDLAESAVGPEAISFIDNFYDALSHDNIAEVRSDLSPKVKDVPAKAIKKVMDFVPSGPPLGSEIFSAGMTRSNGDGPTLIRVGINYRYPRKWIQFTIEMEESDDTFQVTSFYVRPVSMQEVARNDFNFLDKSLLHYIVFAIVVIVPLFSLYVLTMCLRSPLSWRAKVLWSVFILCSLSKFSFNWTTGSLSVQPLAFVLFGAAFITTTLGPIIFSVGLPVGAVIFWLKRASLVKGSDDKEQGLES